MKIMISRQVVVIFLFLQVASFLVESENQLHHFKFHLLWPNSYCNPGIKRCKLPVPQEFKIHGMFPFTSNDVHVHETCGDRHFPKTEVKNWNFSESLSTYWPNLMEGREDLPFWEWEWNKHGVYSGMNAENYFYLAVTYAKKYEKLYKSLLKGGVVTPSDQPYRRGVLRKELSRVLHSFPELRCHEYNNFSYQLSDVCICIDIHGVAINCSRQFSMCGRSKSRILFATEETVLQSCQEEVDMVETPSTFQKSKLNVKNQTNNDEDQLIL